MKNILFPMNLQLFAEGGAAAGGEGTGEGAGVSAPAAGVQTKGAKNPLANVVYGKQPVDTAPAAEVQTDNQPTEKPVDRTAEFEAMIKGDYKEAYDKRVQDTIQKRLKGANETIAKYEATLPLMDMLAAKYKVDASDPAAIMKAMEEDDDFFESVASEHGMDAKAYRNMAKLERENERLRNQQAEQAKQAQLNQQYAVWEQQAQQAKQLYPNLNLNVECQNSQFRQLLMSGIDVKTAYKVIHDDEITSGLIQHATQTAKQQVANSVAAAGKRPAENGMQAQSSVTIKSDPSKWTKADRAEVARRAARGEKIYL